LLLLRMMPQQVEVNHPIGVRVQDKPPRIPTLRNVVRDINGNHASESTHGKPHYQKKSPAAQKRRTLRPVCLNA
jgi:hypothetical protein